MSPTELLVLLTAVFGVILLVLFAVFSWVKNLAQQRTAVLITDYPDHIWVEQANYFGRQSAGMMQIRGNCTLLLTRDALISDLWKPQKRTIIPLNSITKITLPRSFLGKSKGQRLLRVDFSTENQPDAIAWLVRSPDALQASIDHQRSAV